MNRRYYGLKALLLAVAIGLAMVSAIFGTPEFGGPAIRVHYGAAATVEAAALRTTAQFSRAVRDLVRRVDCSITHVI